MKRYVEVLLDVDVVIRVGIRHGVEYRDKHTVRKRSRGRGNFRGKI